MSTTQKDLLEQTFKKLAQHGYETRKLIGDLSNLNTAAKQSLVDALNEVLTKQGSSEPSGSIDESAVNRLIDAKIKALVDGAPEELDTLQEVATEMKRILEELSKDDLAHQAVLTKIAGLQEGIEALNFSGLPERIENILRDGHGEAV